MQISLDNALRGSYIIDMKNTKSSRYEVVEGTRMMPGRTLAAFDSSKNYRCGGPATACLRAWDKMDAAGVQCFFRKVS